MCVQRPTSNSIDHDDDDDDDDDDDKKFVLRRLSEETNGEYSIAGDENHYRDALMAQCTPPPTQPGREGAMFADLVKMGFPAETQVIWSRPCSR